ncbi:MAG: TRAP transporter permease [Firmicutes bacterium]|nr:TRAP transporter permease [Bacillota bacterium]
MLEDKTTHASVVPQPDAEKVLEQFDTESRFRKYTGFWAKVVSVLAIAMSLFHLYTAGFGSLMAMKQRGIHLAFLLGLSFLLYPGSKKSPRNKPTFIDLLWFVAGVGSSLYIVFFFDAFNIRGAANIWDYTFGVITILSVLEATRRTNGKELVILSLVFWLYGLFGDMIPGLLGHTGFSFKRIVYHIYLSSEGIFGVALGVSATYIFLFTLFGAFLGETGMAQFINDFSMALAGQSPGGPGKVAVFAAGLMGTINGSAVANVATVGSFTIPLMVKMGYTPVFSAACTAVASTGGMIMPPVMGAAAFVMAEFLGISYTKIMIAAILPAVLYYVAVYVMVHIEAIKLGLTGLPKDKLPDMRYVLRTRGHLIIPLIVIVYLLLSGRTPLYAAFYGIISTIACSWLRKETRLSIKGFLKALESGARSSISVGMACAVVGNIIGITSLTGLGLVVGDNIISLAKGNVFLTLLLTMAVSIILGMGLPTTACYIISATIAAPALTKIGVDPFPAHLFCFYFACLSNLTPPVALAAYTGAGIAGANPAKVGWTAFRMSLAGFIIPFIFVYSPALMLHGTSVPNIIIAVITSIIGVISLAAATQNYLLQALNIIQRVMLFAAALTLIIPGLLTDLIGLGLLAGVYFWQKSSMKTVSAAKA